ncbi:MAG: helix-turn-helix domain-containing protein [Patescibacteria group bacterium]|nr:helix-turn-helix domain-containing protein [Patescibacteria group bacterium]
MTGTEFKSVLKALGISQAEFARRIGYTSRTVNQWASGSWPVPLVVQRLLEAYSKK